MKRYLFILILIATCVINALPKKEMRGVWVASLGIDWPVTSGAKGYDASMVQLFRQIKRKLKHNLF